MPSTTSSAVSVVFDSSTVITPSPPTFSMASATSSPMAAVVVGGDRRDLRLLLARRDRPRQRSQRLDRGLGATVQAALDVDRAGAGDDIAHAVGKDRVRQDGRGAGAVADHVAGLLGRLAQHRAPRFSSGSLRSNSLAMVTPSLQTIGAPHFFSIRTDFDRGPKRHAHGVGKLGRAAQDFLAGGRTEQDLFVCHERNSWMA